MKCDPAKAWKLLAYDYPDVQNWFPGCRSAAIQSPNTCGLGAIRKFCRSDGTSFLEKITVYDERTKYFLYDAYDFTPSLPVNLFQIGCQISEVSGNHDICDLTVTFYVKVKYGPIGWLLARLVLRGKIQKGCQSMLEGFSYYAVSGNLVGDVLPPKEEIEACIIKTK